MPAFTGLRQSSTMENILQQVITQLTVTNTVYDPSACYISQKPDYVLNVPHGDKFFVIAVGKVHTNQSIVDGGASDGGVPMEGVLYGDIWLRLQADILSRDDDWLKAALGVLPVVQSTIKNLQLFDPFDQAGTGNGWLSQPMRLIDYDVEGRTNLAGWGRIRTSWEVLWQQSIP